MNYANGLALCGVIIAASAAITVTASPVDAEPIDARQTGPIVVTGTSDMIVARISHRDLNLASADGERALAHRVKGAIGRVCAEAADLAQHVPCRWETWSDTRPQIARAVARARDIAATGTSAIPAVAITIHFRH